MRKLPTIIREISSLSWVEPHDLEIKVLLLAKFCIFDSSHSLQDAL